MDNRNGLCPLTGITVSQHLSSGSGHDNGHRLDHHLRPRLKLALRIPPHVINGLVFRVVPPVTLLPGGTELSRGPLQRPVATDN